MLFSRQGDLLLPLAIGPFYDPTLETATNLTPTTDFDRENVARMTLSGALAARGRLLVSQPGDVRGHVGGVSRARRTRTSRTRWSARS